MKKLALLIVCIFVAQLVQSQECLNIEYKLRGYFHVGTSQLDKISPGGFYAAENAPKKLTSAMAKVFKRNDFQIIVETDSISNFTEEILGFKVFIANTSEKVFSLNAQDSRLNMVRQVYYDNKWQDVEYLPSSWCGNSYHTVYINPNEYWELTAPCFEGNIKAKFRFQLAVNKEITIYSNEFEGSFNRSQLKMEQGHNPTNIMDPYDD